MVAASAQAGLVGHGVGLDYGYSLAHGGLGYAQGLAYGHKVVAAPVVAKVATPIIASSAITTRADHYTPIIGKALAPVGVAKVGYAAAPIAPYGGPGLGLGGLGYGYGAGLW